MSKEKSMIGIESEFEPVCSFTNENSEGIDLRSVDSASTLTPEFMLDGSTEVATGC